MARWQLQSQNGFTLVESVIAVMVLSMALGACIISFSMAMRIVSTGNNQIAALHVARDQLEDIRTNSFTDTPLNAGTRAFTNGTYTGRYVITSVDSSTKTVAVDVFYINRIRHCYSTNTLTTAWTTTLHP